MSKDSIREAVAREVVRLLKDEREKLGFSMNAVAERSGLSQSMVSLVERDLRNPTLDVLLRMGDALNLDVGAVITKARRKVKNKS